MGGLWRGIGRDRRRRRLRSGPPTIPRCRRGTQWWLLNRRIRLDDFPVDYHHRELVRYWSLRRQVVVGFGNGLCRSGRWRSGRWRRGCLGAYGVRCLDRCGFVGRGHRRQRRRQGFEDLLTIDHHLAFHRRVLPGHLSLVGLFLCPSLASGEEEEGDEAQDERYQEWNKGHPASQRSSDDYIPVPLIGGQKSWPTTS